MSIIQYGVISQAVVLSDVNSYINMNTLFVIVAVLAAMLLIALVYLINIMSYLKNNTKAEHKNSSVDNAIAQIVGSEQNELSDNKELVAVITAAISAYMGDEVPADGFVVRSIRKANR